jgi:hypothetical protein
MLRIMKKITEIDLLDNWFGVLERITVHGYMLWVIVLALVLFREQRKSLQIELFG